MTVQQELMRLWKTMRQCYLDRKNIDPFTDVNDKRLAARPVVIGRPGVIWAIKRITRRKWVKEGYLDDFLWIIMNGDNKAKHYAIENAWRNGFWYKWESIDTDA